MLDAAKVCQLLLQVIIHRPRCSAAFIQRKEPMCFVHPPVNAGTVFFFFGTLNIPILLIPLLIPR